MSTKKKRLRPNTIKPRRRSHMAWILARRVAERKNTPRAILMESIERMTEFGSGAFPYGQTPGQYKRDQKQREAAAKRRAEVARENKKRIDALNKAAKEKASDPYNDRTSQDNLALLYVKLESDLKEERKKFQDEYEEAKAKKDRARAKRLKYEIERLDGEIKRVLKLYQQTLHKRMKDSHERLSKSFERMGEGAQFVSWSTRMTATPMPNQVSRKFINGGYFLA